MAVAPNLSDARIASPTENPPKGPGGVLCGMAIANPDRIS